MPSPFQSVAAVVLGCLAIPANLHADDAVDYVNRGLESYNQGEFDKAIADYSEAIRLDPNDANAYNNRGNAWRRKREYDKAIVDCTEAIRLNPIYAEAYNDRGLVRISKGETDKAIGDFAEAIRLNPQYVNAYKNRGVALNIKGETDKAIADYTAALRLRPNDAAAYDDRGHAWYDKGEYGKAVADYTEAVRVNPNNATVYKHLARFQATCPDEKYRDGNKAVENASKACQLTKEKNWECLDILAMAYAESGDFEMAMKWEAKAIQLVMSDSSATDKAKTAVRSHLELYGQGKPFHEPN